MSFALTCVVALATAVFIKFDGIKIYQNTIYPRYKKFRELNKLVATQHKANSDSASGIVEQTWSKESLKRSWFIFSNSMSIVGKLLYRNAVQWATNNVIQIDKNTYEVSYVLDGRLYKVVTLLHRGPRKVLLISDHNQEDVTDHIHSYIGPK